MSTVLPYARGVDVELAGLEVIQRYSLVVRQPTADAADVVAALRADLARLEAVSRARPFPGRPSPDGPAPPAAPRPTARRAPVARRRG